jgi:hypothetical protein
MDRHPVECRGGCRDGGDGDEGGERDDVEKLFRHKEADYMRTADIQM